MTLVPAYGRDYKTAKEVKEAWEQGKDFEVADMFTTGGRYCNKQDIGKGNGAQVRFCGMRKVTIVKG
jgi:hypothetical protein